MNDKCFDIGMIQTYIDGELESSPAKGFMRHLADCKECATLVEDLEAENEMAFAALDSELNVLVPTERLRRKVFTSINEIESTKGVGVWGRLTAALGLTGLLARPSVAAFASIVLFVGVATVGYSFIPNNSTERAAGKPLAVDSSDPESTVDSETELVPVASEEEFIAPPTVVRTSAESPIELPTVEKAAFRKTPAQERVRKVSIEKLPVNPDGISDQAVPTVAAVEPNVGSEDGYLTTIATLNRTVDQSKDYVLRPSERVVYERDLAVVNDAIQKMRGEVKKNPANSAAREVLQSSYKSKIDLLNSVAERSPSVAARD